MAIDYVIDYKCYPKHEITTEGILERIKGRARAEAVIKLFRDNGDNRPVPEIGFELERTTASGESETKIVMIQTLLDQSDELLQYEHYCAGCPANNTGAPFGCIGQIEYPISGKAELWLLNQLPLPTETYLGCSYGRGYRNSKRRVRPSVPCVMKASPSSKNAVCW